jgi:hypothetical protein
MAAHTLFERPSRTSRKDFLRPAHVAGDFLRQVRSPGHAAAAEQRDSRRGSGDEINVA